MCKLHIIYSCKNTIYIHNVFYTKIFMGDKMKFVIKKQEYANRTFRLPLELLEELNRLAANKNISLNQLVVQCCEFAIDNLDEKAEK